MNTIAIIGEGLDYPVREIEGLSSKPYIFTWNRQRGQYEYELKDQDEANDLFGATKLGSVYFFVPVLVKAEPAPAAAVAPDPKAEAPVTTSTPEPKAEAPAAVDFEVEAAEQPAPTEPAPARRRRAPAAV